MVNKWLLLVRPLLCRDQRTPRRRLRAHASQVCHNGRTAARLRLPQLDAERSAVQHGEHPCDRGAPPGASVHRGVPETVGEQRPGSRNLLPLRRKATAPSRYGVSILCSDQVEATFRFTEAENVTDF